MSTSNKPTMPHLELIKRHGTFIASGLLILVIMLLLRNVALKTSDISHSMAVADAKIYSDALAEFRTLYSSEVVARVQDHGIQVTHDYKDHAGAIPLPATLSMMLGNRISESAKGGSTRLYSDYPFPWSESKGPKDKFERDALDHLRLQPFEPFHRVEIIDGKQVLRYATADLMRASCIQCHNEHPDSPKRDWKVGDVRGVLAIALPMDAGATATTDLIWFTTVGVAILGIIGIGGFALATHFTKRNVQLALNADRSNEIAKRLMLREKELSTAVVKMQQNQAALETQKNIAISRSRKLESARKATVNILRDTKKAKQDSEAAGHQLKISETRAQAVLETAADAIIRTDEFGVIQDFNKSAEETFGYKRNEVIGENIKSFIPAHYREKYDTYLAKYRDGQAESIINIGREITARRKDGTTFPILLSINEFWIDDKRFFTGIIRDITDQKKAADEIATQTRQLEQSNRDLDTALREAQAAANAKSEFLANMSHELRTPMTAILGFADLLLNDTEEVDQTESIKTIKDNSELLLRIINDILDLASIEAGKLNYSIESVSPQKLVAEVVELMQIRADAKHLSLSVEPQLPLPFQIQTDPHRLRQILINLIGNAIKFTQQGSVRVVIRMRKNPGAEGQIQFEVIDTGIGIAAADIEQLFQPFGQVDSSASRQYGGTGLGLSISQRLANLLGGEMSVTSVPGEGSTFTVAIAVGETVDKPESAKSVDETAQPGKAKSEAEVPDKLDCRILYAEDGPDNQRLVSFLLKKAGAEVVVAENGALAIEQVVAAEKSGQPFDLILMDMQMPVLDGYQATRQLRDDGYTLPIIALTAHAMTGDRDKCIDAGCDDYLSKPIDRKRLISLVASQVQCRNESNAGIEET